MTAAPLVPLFIQTTGPFPHGEGRRRVAGGRIKPFLAELREALQVSQPPGLQAVRDAARVAWERENGEPA